MTVYIISNFKKTTLYIGVTNSLDYRLVEHYRNRGKPKSFAGRYNCYYLLYYENHDFADGAIQREKEIKKWNRRKKEELINSFNPDWTFLNDQIIDWPPEEGLTGRV